MTITTGRLSTLAASWTSSVDKHSVAGEAPVRLCNYTDVYKNERITGDVDFMRATASDEQISRFRIRRGDTLITKDSETADDIGVPAFVDYEAPDLVCGYHLAIIRPDPSMTDPRFLYWAMSSRFVSEQWAVLAAGVTRVGLRRADIGRVSVPVLAVKQQRAIADYLDRATARIDALIAKQEDLLQALRVRRSAVIRLGVMRGLGDHPTRDSGVPWIGAIPSHWTARRISWMFRSTGSGTTPPTEAIVEPGDRTTWWVTTGELRERPIWSTQKALTQETVAKSSALKLYPPGTLLMAMYGATIGRLGILEVSATTNQACAAMVGPVDCDVAFVAYALMTAREHIVLQASGGGQPNINQEKVRAIRLPAPPIHEQRGIAEWVDQQTSKIDKIIAKAEQFIVLSKERRSALITAAVTGQIDVEVA